MTLRINCFHEDFSGLTRCRLSTVPVERRFLVLIQDDIYRQREKDASQFCIKSKNLRFFFYTNFITIMVLDTPPDSIYRVLHCLKILILLNINQL